MIKCNVDLVLGGAAKPGGQVLDGIADSTS